MADPQAVFQRHWNAVQSGDFDAIAADYAADARLIQPEQAYTGHDGCRAFFGALFADLDGFQAHQDSVTVAGDVVLLTWSGVHADGRTAEGVDTFVIRDDLIRTQTLVFHVKHSPAARG